MSKLKDIIGQKFGRLTVIERVENYRQANGRTRTRYLCKCDCGKDYIADGQHLIHGNVVSCGCLKNEKTAQRNRERAGTPNLKLRKDLTGMKFGKLTVIEPYDNMKTRTAWLCKCECGNTTKVRGNHLLRGLIKSCGCVSSYGEKCISKLLTDKNINFDTQYIIKELKSKNNAYLKFDFALLDDNKNMLALLEYQGAQHLLTDEREFGKQQREETDDQKIDYCYEHNIPLYFIWFYSDIEEELSWILNEVYCMSTPCQASDEEGVTTISEESRE